MSKRRPVTLSQTLIDLFLEMSEHTSGECASSCRCPRSCCSPEYGEMAIETMQQYGEKPPTTTGNPRCQFLGPKGCIVAPHFRPLCTLHVCCINSFGFKPGDPKWTKRYFEIKEKIDNL